MIAIIKLISQETLLARQIYRSNDKISLVDPLEMKFYSDHSDVNALYILVTINN